MTTCQAVFSLTRASVGTVRLSPFKTPAVVATRTTSSIPTSRAARDSHLFRMPSAWSADPQAAGADGGRGERPTSPAMGHCPTDARKRALGGSSANAEGDGRRRWILAKLSYRIPRIGVIIDRWRSFRGGPNRGRNWGPAWMRIHAYHGWLGPVSALRRRTFLVIPAVGPPPLSDRAATEDSGVGRRSMQR